MDKYYLPTQYNTNLRRDIDLDVLNKTDKTYQVEVYQKARQIYDSYNYNKVLDIGCGLGYKLINNFPSNTTVGIDLPDIINVAKNHLVGEWNVLDIENVNQSCDVAICADVLEHLENPDDIIQYLIKTNCQRFIFSTPIRKESHMGPPENIYHIREWTFNEFEQYIKQYFDIEEHFVSNDNQHTQCIVAKIKSFKKLFIVPYFGDIPQWIDKYLERIESLKQYGFDWMLFTDKNEFIKLVKSKLDIELDLSNPIKTCDLRPAYGIIFEDYLKEYDFWGHVDLDIVFGRLELFITDELLNTGDILTCQEDGISGPLTLFRNNNEINNLFKNNHDWKQLFSDTTYHRLDEHFIVNLDNIIVVRRDWRKEDSPTNANPYKIQIDGRILHDKGINNEEIPLFHFRIAKKWPINT